MKGGKGTGKVMGGGYGDVQETHTDRMQLGGDEAISSPPPHLTSGYSLL